MLFKVKFVVGNIPHTMSMLLAFPPTGIENFSFPYYLLGEAGSLETTVKRVDCTPSLKDPEFIVFLSVNNMHPQDLDDRIRKLNDKRNESWMGVWEKR